jgi:glycosyltransferase involved in cell wall biosynthesis
MLQSPVYKNSITEMTQKVLLDLERLKYPNTGLYHFDLQLGKALVATNKNPLIDFTFYLPDAQKNLFNSGIEKYIQRKWHKIYFPMPADVKIWHGLYQGTAYFPKPSRIKKILTIHDLNFLYDQNKKAHKKKKYLKTLQSKIDRVDKVVAISNFVLDDIKTHLNLDKVESSVIYNGCNIEPIEMIKPPLSIPATPFFFTIGTITDKKNFHVLLPLLQKNEHHLIIAGIVQNEEYYQKILTYAKELGVSDRLIFTGAISENDKQWYYKNCAAFLFPSLAEGFGLPVIEAMSFGKLVVLSTHTSLPEIGGPYCYYFKNFDPDSMQQTLTESMLHYNENNLAEQIILHASKFSWEKAALQYHSIYQQLL